MNQITSTAAACLLFATGATLAVDQGSGAQNAQPGIESSTAVTRKATVQAIDYQDRMLTLKGQDGKTFTVKVGDEARNFNQIQKGDQVTVRREESLALALQKANEPATSGEQQTLMRAPAGQKPSGAAITTTQVTATVENINRPTREVTLRLPDGRKRTLKVGKDIEALDRLKRGDQVRATYTDAFMVDVTAPNK